VTSYFLFCSCPKGLGFVLADEINTIAQRSSTLSLDEVSSGGVMCKGTLSDIMILNLHSRIASRILLKIGRSNYTSEKQIYNFATSLAWETWFDADKTIKVETSAVKSPLKSLNFVKLKVKDAICDRFRRILKKRPSVKTKFPDLRIFTFLDNKEVTLYLDTSGESLFKRGWRQEKGDAPIKENLAAALLKLSGWVPGIPLIDPMCGSGTIIIEAAQIMSGIPAGINRRFSFENLLNFDYRLWNKIKEDSKKSSINLPENPNLFCSDISKEMVQVTKNNIEKAKIKFNIPVKQINAKEILSPTRESGIILTNPPYSQRLNMKGESKKDINDSQLNFYKSFSSILKKRFINWNVFFFTADFDIPKMLRFKEAKKISLFNGTIECKLFLFKIIAGSNRKKLTN
tara:strand:- start:491 stop:1693 length:1203 start_codon:yes stop_codon:yes gene_type:complete